MNEQESPQEFRLPEPGPQHELLKPFEGNFRAEVKMYMGPGEPMVSTGSMTNTFEVNGLYLHQNYLGDAVEGPFPNFQGKGYWGFNAGTNLFEGFWIDTASTAMQMETGNVDESGKVFEMKSKFKAPDGSDMEKRSVFTVVDENHHRMDAYITPPGASEMKHMEIEYTRV